MDSITGLFWAIGLILAAAIFYSYRKYKGGSDKSGGSGGGSGPKRRIK